MTSYALKLIFLEGNYSVEPWLFGEPNAERLKEAVEQVRAPQEIVSAQLVDQNPWTVVAEVHRMVVGRTLFLSNRNHRVGHESLRKVTVTKMGRKWILLSNGQRIDKDTFEIDGGDYSSPGRAYWTEEVYQTEVALQAAWSSFVDSVQRARYAGSLLEGLTVEKIQKATELLGLPPTP